MRFNRVVEKCSPEFHKVLKGKLGRGYRDGLKEKDIEKLTLVVFSVLKDILETEGVKTVLTPIGSFRKYFRKPYRNFSPVKNEYQTIEGGVKCKFKIDESIKIK